MSRFCRNPHCGDWLPSGDSVVPLCQSCRYIGRLWILLGGLVVGGAIAALKAFGRL